MKFCKNSICSSKFWYAAKNGISSKNAIIRNSFPKRKRKKELATMLCKERENLIVRFLFLNFLSTYIMWDISIVLCNKNGIDSAILLLHHYFICVVSLFLFLFCWLDVRNVIENSLYMWNGNHTVQYNRYVCTVTKYAQNLYYIMNKFSNRCSISNWTEKIWRKKNYILYSNSLNFPIWSSTESSNHENIQIFFFFCIVTIIKNLLRRPTTLFIRIFTLNVAHVLCLW